MNPRSVERTKTKEPQNQIQMDTYRERGGVQLGPWSSHIWRQDPRHLGFLLARYKFCAKMLAGKAEVLEIGCGDAIGIPVMLQTTGFVHGIDVESLVIEDAKARLKAEGIWQVRLSVLDITAAIPEGRFDAAYSLDVIEHIPAEDEDVFMRNICRVLTPHGILILGTPNVEASKHASAASAEGHVNLKDAHSLQTLVARYFHNVFLFSMNDEIIHTGYYPMAHYLLGIGVGVKVESL